MACTHPLFLLVKWILQVTNKMHLSNQLSIGLTGLMGSGKSEAAHYFKRAGYPVLFMDEIGHTCLQEPNNIKTLKNYFGPKILDDHNNINRKKLSQLVFNNPKKLHKLNAFLHPKMNQKAKDWIKQHFITGDQLVFIEAAILFEMQMNKFLDYTVLIKAKEKELINRIMKRDHKSINEIKQILETQKMNENQVDYVIVNDDTLKVFYQKCDQLLKQLLQEITVEK